MKRFGFLSDKIVLPILVATVGVLFYLHHLVDESTRRLKAEEIERTKAYAAHIVHLIRQKTGNRIEESLVRNPALRESLQTILEALLTQRYEYLFVIKREKPRLYRFLLDGSQEDKEAFGAIFIPVSDVYDEVYDAKRPRIVKQEDVVKGVWLSLLYPIVIDGKTQAMLVLDLADWYGKQLEHFNSPVSRILTLVQWFFGVVVVLLLLLSWRYHHLRKHLYVDKVSGAHTKAYLFDYLGERPLDRFHAAIVDIDELKVINKLYGYEIGDRLLREFVSFSRWHLPKGVQLIYFGGSEFFLLIPHSIDLDSFIERYYTTLKHEIFHIEGYEITLRLSMCAVTIPEHTTSLQYVQHILYETLMEIKKRGKNAYRIVHLKDIKALHYRQIDYIHDLLTKENVHLIFQPIYDVKKQKTVKYEALVRLYDRQANAYISPEIFLDMIRGTSLYVKLSRFVFEEVFALLKRHPQLELSVNIGLDDLFNQEIEMMFDRFLQRNSDEAKRLTFEILESSPITSYEEINTAFKTLRRYGAKIAIDDFGSGYADFQHLAYLEADFVKIDGNLVRRLKNDDDRIWTIIQNIVDVAHGFGVQVVAEYVEDEEIYEKIVSLGFDYAQGYYIGKPDRLPCEKD